MHADFDCFEGTEEDVGEEFGGGRGAKVDDCLVGIGEESLAVEVFEDFVEPVLAGALEGVANESGGPAEEDAAETFFGEDGTPSGYVGFVDIGVDLAAAFYLNEREVRWCYCWRKQVEELD